MREAVVSVAQTPLFGLTLCLLTFRLGVFIQKKTRAALINPIIVAIALCIAFLKLTGISYEAFSIGGGYLTMLLSPATALLSLYIYNQLALLKRYAIPVLAGCLVGSACSIGLIMAMCRLSGLDAAITAALMPKSCTTPIAIAIARGHGGIEAIAVIAVIITGITGAVAAPLFIRLFRVKDPVAQGLAIGACSHVMGTTKAVELGEIQGAVSSVAIGVCGLFSVIIAAFI